MCCQHRRATGDTDTVGGHFILTLGVTLYHWWCSYRDFFSAATFMACYSVVGMLHWRFMSLWRHYVYYQCVRTVYPGENINVNNQYPPKESQEESRDPFSTLSTWSLGIFDMYLGKNVIDVLKVNGNSKIKQNAYDLLS